MLYYIAAGYHMSLSLFWLLQSNHDKKQFKPRMRCSCNRKHILQLTSAGVWIVIDHLHIVIYFSFLFNILPSGSPSKVRAISIKSMFMIISLNHCFWLIPLFKKVIIGRLLMAHRESHATLTSYKSQLLLFFVSIFTVQI